MPSCIQTSAVVRAAASFASATAAQQAVPRRAQHGGADDGYRFDQTVLHRRSCRTQLRPKGGDLTSVTPSARCSLVRSALHLQSNDIQPGETTDEPSRAWMNGQPMAFTNWCAVGCCTASEHAIEVRGPADRSIARDGTAVGADLGVLRPECGPASADFPQAVIHADRGADGVDPGLVISNLGACS